MYIFFFYIFRGCSDLGHVCLRLTGKRVGDVVFHLYIHKQRGQSQSLVLLIPQTDVVITCMVIRVAVYKARSNKSSKTIDPF